MRAEDTDEETVFDETDNDGLLSGNTDGIDDDVLERFERV